MNMIFKKFIAVIALSGTALLGFGSRMFNKLIQQRRRRARNKNTGRRIICRAAQPLRPVLKKLQSL